MNRSPLILQSALNVGRGSRGARAHVWLLAACLILSLLTVSAQDPNPAAPTNPSGPGPAGPGPSSDPGSGPGSATPATPLGEAMPLNGAVLTNGLPLPNTPGQSNPTDPDSEPGSPNESGQPASPAQANPGGGPNTSGRSGFQGRPGGQSRSDSQGQSGFQGQTDNSGNRDFRNNRTDNRNRGNNRNRGSSRGGDFGSSGSSPDSASTNRLEFSYYRLIFDRNIFNPNRRPQGRFMDQAPTDYQRPRRVDTFSLVGTMAYEKGVFAFFDGSGYQYRKTAKPGEIIAGYGISEVGHDYVKLVSKTNQLELRIGMQMRRDDGGDWSLRNQFGGLVTAASSGASDATAGGTNALAAAGDPSAPPIIPADSKEAEILKRLMERRAQELSK